jgi:predicted RNA polymerase sigma factor
VVGEYAIREVRDGEDEEDDRLRLIFTCCHPALSPEAQVPSTLREVRGLRLRVSRGLSSSTRRRWPSASCVQR